MERGTKGGEVSLLPVGVPWLVGFTNGKITAGEEPPPGAGR